MLQLKHYQELALESLQTYLRECDRKQDANSAFYETTRQVWGDGIPYNAIKQPSELADIPYVCIRVPTGGGKTLMACHTVTIANKEYLKKENSLVLWLVPSNAIKEQTLGALKNPIHPYRQALETTVGRVEVMDLQEALYLQAGTLQGNTVVIVATLQAFRVEDKEGRKVYESAGALQHHFQGLPEMITALLDKDESGIVPYSLANVMRIHRPLVIVDEAHNARTELSFDTLARFRPSAILEFSATPDKEKNPSNVLHSVSAAELKAENMIKLPIRLETSNDWKSLLGDAVALLGELEKKAIAGARKTGDYIRPIMLLQAQPTRQGRETLDVEVVEKALLEDHKIPTGRIARATGEDKGLEGVDLRDEKCEIRFVITKQALREGWDCPFAYVLFSVAEQRATGAVEQLLGRVLRLPYAKPLEDVDLNRAYAFVTSQNFEEAAMGLVDALVENGFNRQEASEFIKPRLVEQIGMDLQHSTRPMPTRVVPFSGTVDEKKIPADLSAKVRVDTTAKTITLIQPLSAQETQVLTSIYSHSVDAKKLETNAKAYSLEVAVSLKTPAERGVEFKIPVLCVKDGQEILPFDEDMLLDRGWSPLDCDPKLTEEEFAQLGANRGSFGEVDVTKEGRITHSFIPELNQQLKLITAVENWNDSQLIAWLERNLPFIEVTPQEKEKYLLQLSSNLLDQRGMKLAELVRKKFELLKMIEIKMNDCRKAGLKTAYQETLFGKESSSKIVVGPEKLFAYSPDPGHYPARNFCPETFNKHYYHRVGDLKSDGEEYRCAKYLDQLDEIDVWVRNLERQPLFSFWLQTPTDKFYPDFVCKLKDGRYLVVEYKGSHLYTNEDSKEKHRLGELWAEKSKGKCLFFMSNGMNLEAIKTLIDKK